MNTRSVFPLWQRKNIRLVWIMGLLFVLTLPFGVALNTQVMASPSQQSQTVVKIGYIGESDSDLAQGIKLAIQQLNGVGGIQGPNNTTFTFQLVIEEVVPDNPDAVPDAIQFLVSQGVSIIFGPDNNRLTLPNLTGLSSASVPVFTAATGETVQGQDINQNIFRIVSQESVYSEALASYLINDRGLTRFTVFQVGIEWTEAILSFDNVLRRSNASSTLVQLQDNTELLSNVLTVASDNPQSVVFFGSSEDALRVLSELRNEGWTGIFAYRTAQEALLTSEGFDQPLAAGMIGVDSWTFGVNDELGTIFLKEYIQEYGEIPGALAVAGYDTMFAFSTVVSRVGIAPAQIRQTMNQVRPLSPVRGPIDPASYGNRNLSQTAFVYQLTGQGGIYALTAYDDGLQRDPSEFTRTVVAAVASPTPTPTLTPTSTPTLTPTATLTVQAASPTPSVLTATVNTNRLNVRPGPGTIYEPALGQLRRGDQVQVLGSTADRTWYAVLYQGRQGWVTAEFVVLFDPFNYLATLPVLPAPPTPTPPPTALPTEADLIITSVVLSVTQPEPGVAFTATVTIKNQGAVTSGASVVVTNFRPDETAVISGPIPPLASQQTTTVSLGPATLTQTGYVPDLAFIVDFNSQVNEGVAGENNNRFFLTYKVDEPTHIQNITTLTAPTSFDFWGGTADISWDGTTLTMLAGGLMGQVTNGNTYEQVHYQQAISLATSASFANPQVGNVFAIKTVEGQYGYIRVDARSGTSIVFSFRVYNP